MLTNPAGLKLIKLLMQKKFDFTITYNARHAHKFKDLLSIEYDNDIWLINLKDKVEVQTFYDKVKGGE